MVMIKVLLYCTLHSSVRGVVSQSCGETCKYIGLSNYKKLKGLLSYKLRLSLA